MFLRKCRSNGEENTVSERHVGDRYPLFQPAGRHIDISVGQGRSTDLFEEIKIDLVVFFRLQRFGDLSETGKLFVLCTLSVVEMQCNDPIALFLCNLCTQGTVHSARYDTDCFFHHYFYPGFLVHFTKIWVNFGHEAYNRP